MGAKHSHLPDIRMPVVNVQAWIEENQHSLKPPLRDAFQNFREKRTCPRLPNRPCGLRRNSYELIRLNSIAV